MSPPSPQSNSIELQVMNFSTHRRRGYLSWKTLYETRLQNQVISNELAQKENTNKQQQHKVNKLNKNRSNVRQRCLQGELEGYYCPIAVFPQDAGAWCEKNLFSVYWRGIPLSTFVEEGQRLNLCPNASVPALHLTSGL